MYHPYHWNLILCLTSLHVHILLHSNLFITWFIIAQFWIQDGLKMAPKNVVSKQKCINYIKKWPNNKLSFFCIIYIFLFGYNMVVELTVLPLDPSNTVMKRLWCVLFISCPKVSGVIQWTTWRDLQRRHWERCCMTTRRLSVVIMVQWWDC